MRIWAVLPEERAAELAACTPSHDPEQPQLPSFISRCLISAYLRRHGPRIMAVVRAPLWPLLCHIPRRTRSDGTRKILRWDW